MAFLFLQVLAVFSSAITANFGFSENSGANKSVENLAQERFEAAFQGECREGAPCQQLCFDLHDGTFECGCKQGYTLFADGYTCLENSEYDLLWNLNLTSDERTEESKRHVFHYARGSTYEGGQYVLNKESPDPRARTLSQSENRSSRESDVDFALKDTYKPQLLEEPKDDSVHDGRHVKRLVTPTSWMQVIKAAEDKTLKQSSTHPMSEETSPDELEPVNTVTMTTLPSSTQSNISLCESIRCLNGGTCIPTNEKYKCRCVLGWAGPLCEKHEEVRYPRFKSHSYLSLRPTGASDRVQDFRIELEFRPELYEGMLLSVNTKENTFEEDSFCTLVLMNGIIEVRYFNGLRTGYLRSDQAVVLNSWNRVKVTFDKSKIWIQLNEESVHGKSAIGVYPTITQKSRIFLGGLPNDTYFAVGYGFQGCVRRLDFNDYSYSFRTRSDDVLAGADLEECRPGVCNTVSCLNGGQCAAVRPNWGTCLCPLGFGGDQCGDAVDIFVPSFDGTAHLQFPGLASTSLTFTEILLVFLPRSPNGALLYNGYRINGTGDFLSLSMSEGYVLFKFDLGTGINAVRSENPISMHQWHQVLLTRTGRLGSLQVDQEPPLRIVSSGGYSQLSLPLNLYLGGVPSPKELASGAEVQNSFVGCVQKLVINGKPVKLVEQALSGVNINNCDHPCSDKPCNNGGTCLPNLDSYSCKCTSGYTGPTCSTEIVDMVTRPMFMGTSYLHYVNEHILSRLRGQSLQMSLAFRALAPFGLLLWAGSRLVDSSSDYFALGLYDGHLRLDYNLGSGPVSLFYNHSRVDDGYWHEIKVVRFKQRGSMTVDDTRTVTAVSPGPLKELNIPNELFLGGMPDINHYNAGVYQTGLMGCLSSFTLDSNYKIQFLTMAVTGINIQPCV